MKQISQESDKNTSSNFKRVRVLKLDFDTEVHAQDVSKFRGAVIEKTERAKILFHNHIGENQFRYDYPLIQYKSFKGKACMICIDEGTEEVNSLFRLSDMKVRIGDQQTELSLSGLKANYFNMQVWEGFFEYEMYRWLALNAENYKKFQELTEKEEQIRFLEKILIGNILALATGVGLQIEKQIKVYIIEIITQKTMRYKNAKMLSFTIRFKTNFFIPNYLGLGKGASVGFGVVYSKKGD